MSNRILAVAVVALVALAGCTGGVPGDDGAPSDTTGDLPPVAEQTWVDDNESVAYEQLQESHANVIANASSFEYAQNTSGDGGAESTSRVLVDRDAETVLLQIATTRGGTEQTQNTYVADGVAYSQSGTDGEYRYGSQNVTSGEFEQLVDQQSRLRTTGGVFDALEFEYVGPEDGAYRFEADSIASSEDTSFDASDVTESSATLVVDDDGYVRTLSLTLTVDEGDGESTASLSLSTAGVNETTVEEPSWTDDAA